MISQSDSPSVLQEIAIPTLHKHSLALFFDHFLEVDFQDNDESLTLVLPNGLSLKFTQVTNFHDNSHPLVFNYAVSENSLKHLIQRAEFFLYRIPEHFKGHFKLVTETKELLSVRDPDGRIWNFVTSV